MPGRARKADRLEVRFDPTSLTIWPADVKRRTATNRLRATITQYVENTGARTPSGGKFTSQRFTAMIDGRKWFGQTKNGTDIVRLRPADE